MPQTEEQRTAALTGAGYNPDTFTPGSQPSVPSPINRTVTTATADPAQSFLDTFTPPKSADQIAEDKRKQSQGLIDGINNDYAGRVAEARKAGQERVNQNDAVSILSGLMGSTEAVRTRGAVNDANQKEVDAINNQKATALAQVFSKINSDAATEAQQQLQDATRSAQDIVTRRKQVSEEAVNNLKLMASSGLVDFDAFKSNPKNSAVYQHALDAVGGSEDALRGMFMTNRPKDQLVGSPQRVGDHFIQGYQNPMTGKVSYDTIQVPGLGSEYSSFQKMGDNLVAIPNNWNGDVSKLKTIAGTPSQQDLLDLQYKKMQIQGAGLDNAKKANDLAGGGAPAGYSGQFDATIKLAANAGGGTNAQREGIAQNLKEFIGASDYKSAYAQVVQSTSGGLKGTAATTFQQQNNSIGVLNDLHDAIKAYADAGGSMSIFKGTADKIQTKIGTLMTDPKYAQLATQLDSAFQNYRLQMTGAAFGAKESAEYASVLPDKSNTLDLNLAKLNGAQSYLNSSIESSIKSVVGPGGVYIKQYAEGAADEYHSADYAPVGETVTIGGKQYKKTGTDAYEPL